MFDYLFKERKLNDRVLFVRDYELVTETGDIIKIPKGSKGSKVQEMEGSFVTYENIKLDEPIESASDLVEHVIMMKDFRYIDNIS